MQLNRVPQTLFRRKREIRFSEKLMADNQQKQGDGRRNL